MPPTGSLPWQCNHCGRINEGEQLTCTYCGEQQRKSRDLSWQLPTLVHSPTHVEYSHKRRMSQRFLLVLVSIITLSLLMIPILASNYLSYTPFRIIQTLFMPNNISDIAWSPDSRMFAAVSLGKNVGSGIAMVSVWRTNDDQPLYSYTYPSPPSYGSLIAWSPDGKSFAIVWDDGTLTFWGASNGTSKWRVQSSFRLNLITSANIFLTGFVWSADGKHLIISYSGEQLYVWDIASGHTLPTAQIPRTTSQKLSILALSPDGTQAIIPYQQTDVSDVTYAAWDINTGNILPLPAENTIQADVAPRIAWSSDGKALAASNGDNVIIWQWNKQRNCWTFVRSIEVATFYRGILALAWSPDRQHLATADTANVVRLWNAFTGDLLGPFRLPLFDHPNSKVEEYTDTDQAITGLAWSPNGKYLLSGDSARQILLRQKIVQ